MMMDSRQTLVNYMTPLGLHHLMAWDHHHGPGPWIDTGRPDWTSVYFHRADARGNRRKLVKAVDDGLFVWIGDIHACKAASGGRRQLRAQVRFVAAHGRKIE